MEEYLKTIDKLYNNSDLGLNYSLLQDLLEKIVNNYIDPLNVKYNIFFDIDKTIEICLDFVKTLGKEYYDFFVTTITNNKIISFEQNDIISDSIIGLDGFPLRNKECVYFYNNDYRIYIPITYTIEDIYTIVHEIAHIKEFNSKDSLSKNLFIEVLPITLEKLLSNYLIKKCYSKEEILKHDINRYIGVYYNILDSLYDVTFINIKKKYGEINKAVFNEYVNNIYCFSYLDNNTLNEYINEIKENKNRYLFYLRYIIGQVISIDLINKKYDKQQLMQSLANFSRKLYTKESFSNLVNNGIPNNEIKDKLNCFGIDINNNESVTKVLKNYNSYTKKLIKQRNTHFNVK